MERTKNRSYTRLLPKLREDDTAVKRRSPLIETQPVVCSDNRNGIKAEQNMMEKSLLIEG